MLKGDDDIKEALKKRYLEDENVRRILNVRIDDRYKFAKSNTAKKDFKAILQDHPNFADPQEWIAHSKEKRCAKCTNTNCRKVIPIKTNCLVVNGALSVVYNSHEARIQKFYYCLNDTCHTHNPAWANVRPIDTANLQNDLSLENAELRRILGI